MKILIDLQGAQTQSRHRGIGRYTREAAKAFIASAGTHEIHLALNAALDEEGSDAVIADFLPLLPRNRIHYLRLPTGIEEQRPFVGAWRRAAAARLLRHALDASGADLVWHTSVFEGMIDNATVPDRPSSRYATVATLYDLIPLHEPELHLPSSSSRDWYARRLAFLRRCDLLLAISEWTKRDAVARLGLPAERIAVIGGAVDGRFLPATDAPGIELGDKGITRPFVLYNGGLDPRKNVAVLVQAFAALPSALREKHQLVVLGRGGHEQHELARLGKSLGLAGDALVLPGYVPDDDLVALYRRCALFVFPSRFEGFGLPPLEAMACGAPVLCSNATSLPEVMGREDALFDPDDVARLSERMAGVLADPKHADALREAGLCRARSMNWQAVAARAWAALEKAHAEHGAAGVPSRTPAPPDSVRSDDASTLLVDLAALDPVPAPDDIAQVSFGIASMRPRVGGPRWLVDVSSISRRDLGTGIQQVVRNILRHWLEAPPPYTQVEPVRFEDGHFRHARGYARSLGAAVAGDDHVAMARPGDVFVGLDWAFEQMPAMRPRVADWRRAGVRSCFVVYDLLPIALPAYFHPLARERFTEWLDGAVHLADRFACISRTTADGLSAWLTSTAACDQFGRHAAVEDFPLGVQPNEASDAGALRPVLRHALAKRPTLLMVGTLEPRKGHDDALDLCEALWRGGVDVNLVVAGRRGWMADALIARLKAHPERGRRLFWQDDVADMELAALYSGSSALLALSHGEGYGLPLVEAASHRLPVFARDLPVFREVLGDYPRFLAGDPGDWSAVLAQWIASPSARRDPPRLPTWADSARALATIVQATADA